MVSSPLNLFDVPVLDVRRPVAQGPLSDMGGSQACTCQHCGYMAATFDVQHVRGNVPCAGCGSADGFTAYRPWAVAAAQHDSRT